MPSTRGIHLLALERVPNRLPIPALGVHRHQSSGDEIRGCSLNLEELERALSTGNERHRFRDRRVGIIGRAKHSATPDSLFQASSPAVAHLAPGKFLVPGPRACRMAITRAQESEIETLGLIGIAEISNRQHVLHRGSRAIVERGLENFRRLAGVQPVVDCETGQCLPTGLAGVEIVLPGVCSPDRAGLGTLSHLKALGFDQLTRPPTAWQIAITRRRTTERAIGRHIDLAPWGQGFRISVTRVDLDQGLSLGVVAGQLLSPIRARG